MRPTTSSRGRSVQLAVRGLPECHGLGTRKEVDAELGPGPERHSARAPSVPGSTRRGRAWCTRLREQRLVGVRHLHEAFPDLELDERRGHRLTVSGPRSSLTIESKVMAGSVVGSPTLRGSDRGDAPCGQHSSQASPSPPPLIVAATAAAGRCTAAAGAIPGCAKDSLNARSRTPHAHGRRRQPGLPALVRRRREDEALEGQRPLQRQGLRIRRRLRRREAARLYEGAGEVDRRPVQQLVPAGEEAVRPLSDPGVLQPERAKAVDFSKATTS